MFRHFRLAISHRAHARRARGDFSRRRLARSERLREEIAARGVTISGGGAVDDPRAAGARRSERRSLDGLRWLLPCGEAFAPELCRRFMERYPQSCVCSMRMVRKNAPDDVTIIRSSSRRWAMISACRSGGQSIDTNLICSIAGSIRRWSASRARFAWRARRSGAAISAAPISPRRRLRRIRSARQARVLYRTGDLGRYRVDGVIEFLGASIIR